MRLTPTPAMDGRMTITFAPVYKQMEEWRLGLTFLQKNGLVAC